MGQLHVAMNEHAPPTRPLHFLVVTPSHDYLGGIDWGMATMDAVAVVLNSGDTQCCTSHCN